MTHALIFIRLEILKLILIDDNEEIQADWDWGRNKTIKYHLKFLICQRYIKDKSFCAALEMAYLDCLNIFYKPLKDRDKEMDDSDQSLSKLYEKSAYLFTGIDLRSLLAHRNNIPEAIGGELDEYDFPSEIIKDIMELINDTDAIKAMRDLFKKSGVLEMKEFENAIIDNNFSEDYSQLINRITRCDTWKRYLPLFPF